MKKFTILPLLLLPFLAADCFADSLIITYRSGKTQSVNLDEAIGNISSTEYHSLSTPTAAPPPQAAPAPPSATPASEPMAEQKQKTSTRKGAPRLKWAPPKSGD